MEPLGAQVRDRPSEGGHSVLRGTARALCSQNQSQYKKKANTRNYWGGRTKGRRYNFFTALSSRPFLQGAPASWWNHLHFQHHAKPNCFRKDPDVNMHPLFFALGKTLSVEVRPGEGWEVTALGFKFGKLQRAWRLVTSWFGQWAASVIQEFKRRCSLALTALENKKIKEPDASLGSIYLKLQLFF